MLRDILALAYPWGLHSCVRRMCWQWQGHSADRERTSPQTGAVIHSAGRLIHRTVAVEAGYNPLNLKREVQDGARAEPGDTEISGPGQARLADAFLRVQTDQEFVVPEKADAVEQ